MPRDKITLLLVVMVKGRVICTKCTAVVNGGCLSLEESILLIKIIILAF